MSARRPEPSISNDPRHRFGRDGEDTAARYLRRLGYEIVARNVRMPFGELDLVALDGEVIVFIEVKARRSRGGLEAVDRRKQRRLARLAIAFLQSAGWLDRAARFDVVAVASDGACTHVANAFDCPGF
jgi:putative endonuclease